MLSLVNSSSPQTLWLALLLGLAGDQLIFGTGLSGPVAVSSNQLRSLVELAQNCRHQFRRMKGFAHTGQFPHLDAAQQQFLIDIT